MMERTLEQLVSDAAKIREQWPQIPRLHHGDRGTLQKLFTLSQLDQLIDADCLNPRQILLIRDGQILTSSAFRTRGDYLVPGAIRRHLEAGATLSLRAMHNTFPAIAAACQNLANDLGHPVQANGYLTPGGQQGFAHHWDPHITIIVQLAGSKTWDIYAPTVPDPIYPQFVWTAIGFTDAQRQHLDTDEPDYSFTLQAGDVLWLPRGWIHNPYSPDAWAGPSLHVTIAIEDRTCYWLATSLLSRAAYDADFRRALPPSEPYSPAQISETWNMLRAWFAELDLSEASAILAAMPAPGLIVPSEERCSEL